MSKVSQSKVKKSRSLRRARRHLRVRGKVVGSAERPRLVVYRSLKNTEGQLVDDGAGKTVVGLSTLAPEVRDVAAGEGEHRRVAQARAAGKLLAERALKAGIQLIVFDRGGYRYHGRVKAFAEGAREGGLKF